MEVTAVMVKELREKTNAGMMDCKKALTEAKGDFESAVNWLREKGLSAAAKKSGRVAAEGLIDIVVDNSVAAMVEVNCETDFVAKNPDFQGFVKDLAKTVIKANPANIDALLSSPMADGTVKETLTASIAKIGENMTARRFARMSGIVGSYIHGAGNIGVLVELAVADAAKSNPTTLSAVAKDIAMHAAASSPLFLKRDEADQATIENERNIYREKARAEGKPEKILDKIVEGQVSKFLAENCLLEQSFVKNPDITVQQLLDNTGKDLGTTVSIKQYQRFKVGEGIEKKADDFASEVAKMVGQA